MKKGEVMLSQSTVVRAALAVMIFGCGKPSVPPPADENAGCRACHGGPDGPAPDQPPHSIHLFGGKLEVRVACTSCHVRPANVSDPGHLDGDGIAEVTVEGTWDRNDASCSNTYCHGATLSGGSDKTPIWTMIDGTQSQCGSCHGAPPPAPHTSSMQCDGCHGPVGPETHLDGKLDLIGGGGCNTCHGSDDNFAPPKDTMGRTETTFASVGAHQTHLSGGIASSPVACESCHSVPATIDARGHVDTPLPAEVSIEGS
jgi:predicted CxxxxCH...CXXCH cytochrome family protein